MRWACLLIFLVGGCLDSSSESCGDGTVCPDGTHCVTAADPVQTYCVRQPQLDACMGQPVNHRCTTPDISAGRCYGGACIATACGDGRIDSVDATDPTDLVGEICDEGDQIPGDGCSADCASRETCGNGTIDLVKEELCDDGNVVSHDGCNSECRPETPRWAREHAGDPDSRDYAAMAYDVARHVIVLYGGSDHSSNVSLGDTWVWDGTGWTELIPAQSPGPRYGHSMAYDAARHRIVLHGGTAGSTMLDDTWEFDGTNWFPIAAQASPPRRNGQAMTYDAKRKLVVLYGGEFGADQNETLQDRADTWLYDGLTWTQQVTTKWPSGPAPLDPINGRSKAEMAFDPVRGKVVLFGGRSLHAPGGTTPTETFDDNVWELDENGWEVRTIASAKPPVHKEWTLSYDVVGQRMLLVGGDDGGSGFVNMWTLSASGWTKLTLGPRPESRTMHVSATDPEHRKIVLVGGYADSNTWEWDGTAWSTRTTTTPPLSNWIGTFDARRGRAVMVNDTKRTFELVGNTWVERAAAPSSIGPAIAFDPTRGQTVYVDIGTTTNVTSLFNGTTWSTAAPPTKPPPTYQGILAEDPNGDLVAFGGANPMTGSFQNATWVWNGTTWTAKTPAHQPLARIGAAFAYDPARKITVMFGGTDEGNALFGDTWAWDGTDWSLLSNTGPSARVFASMAWHPQRQRLILFGGSTGTLVSDTWQLDGQGWSRVALAESPSSRRMSVLLPRPDRSSVLLFAGIDLNDPLGDMWNLRWESTGLDDDCRNSVDLDGDGLAGCADPDCVYACAPQCTPGPELATCQTTGTRCGDGACDASLETCRLCPGDCGACAAVCGDLFCDMPESATSCPGDCP